MQEETEGENEEVEQDQREETEHRVAKRRRNVPQILRRLYLDKAELNKWLGEQNDYEEPSTSRENVDDLTNLFKKIFDCYTHRDSEKSYHTLYRDLCLLMSICGLPFESREASKIGNDIRKTFLTRRYSTFQFNTRKSLSYFFHKLSLYENSIRFDLHAHSLLQGGLLYFRIWHDVVPFVTFYNETIHAINTSNRTALLHHIGNRQMFRQFAEKRFDTHHDRRTRMLFLNTDNVTQHVLAPQFFMAILQINIENARYIIDFEKRLLLLAKSYVALLSFSKTDYLSPIMSYITEFLIAAIVHGCSIGTIGKILEMENSIPRVCKDSQFLIFWKNYSLLAEYLHAKRTDAYLPGATFMIDRFIAAVRQFRGSSAVFAEAAMRIRKRTGCEDGEILSIAQLIVQGSADGDVLGSPNLVGRFVEILKSLDFDEEEVDDFVDAAACEELHPSDEKWLDFCHRRISSPHKYGILSEVVASCLQHLFGFLDYGKNRTSSRAWKLLCDSLQMTTLGKLVVFMRIDSLPLSTRFRLQTDSFLK
ncbi:hypothetical protein WR25_26225 isoform G [Diploscapter pachys]|uniref:Uncharacterized protein n=1 Tax=Diploscapter pachys TaxID=2018661 RepID=A0A2A2K0K3_9BILA|nr:hypothetical protein WR25_26225 isoform G [Diploscapter pachys]